MPPARGRIPLLLLGLALAGCSSYRVVVQGVEVDRLVESRTGPAAPEGVRREAVFHNDLGVFLERDGDLEGALEQYRIARAKDRGLVAASINAGNVHVKLGELDRAAQLYREALEREPDNPRALNNLAWVMVMADRDLEEAVELLQRALAADPENRYLYLDSLGWALFRSGEIAAARETLREALEQTPEDETYLLAETHYHLGVILKKGGEREQAIFHFQASLRLHPDPQRERELAALGPEIDSDTDSD
ncbi:MAG: tetratricopeptide repeat protein [Candidatus Erginobacter occultus]|nr:tetratricopeptide repeat protein [Candidatus Erginobacter occultus]